MELILSESREILRAERGVLITETHHGFVCANAGIDSLEPAGATAPSACCPRTPTPRRRRHPARRLGEPPARHRVVIADSFGRAWRLGQAEVAIGCAGLSRWTTGAGARTRAAAS